MSSLRVVILAGGRGERFWPLSRRAHPKPFLDLGSGRSLLLDTFLRASRVAEPSRIRVVAGQDLAGRIRRILRGRGAGPVLIEPAAHNTGPAALLAAREAGREDPRSEILVLPADHRVVGMAAFRSAVTRARRLARRGYLVTFGVRPTGPAPDFGYIVPGEKLDGPARLVRRFVEKPSPAMARTLLDRHRALWNSGMFLWRADAFLDEAARCEPAFRRWLSGAGKSEALSPAAARGFRALPPVPVDKAVLERSRRVAVVPAGFGWSDLGSWSAIYDLRSPDGHGNVGWGDLITWAARRNQAVYPDGLTVLVGVEDLLVVRAGNVTLVCPRVRASEMKEIVRRVREAGYGAYL